MKTNHAIHHRLFQLFGRLLLLTIPTICPVWASENVPHRPFAMWADLPLPGQVVVGGIYEESEAYNFWSGGHNHSARVMAGGESYGIDINQGYLALQYGINEKWAADLSVGITSMGWRYFANGD